MNAGHAKTLEDYKNDLLSIEQKIQTLEIQQNGGYTAQVAKCFHLGMVGGSGRNVGKLNARRGAELDKTIDRAIILFDLYKQRDGIKWKINDIETGADIKREEKKKKTAEALAEYWNNLKAGDYIDIGNGKTLITKKNKKSLETGTGCKWTAYEIIGKAAASLI